MDGEPTTTEPIEIYVSPGPPLGGFRVNLVLSLGGDGEHWIFYIDGFGNDREAASAYCAERNLGIDDCYAAEVKTDDAVDVAVDDAVDDDEATVVGG